MKSANKNRTQERMASIRIASAHLSKALVDGRNSLHRGTVEQLCSQYGVSIKREGRTALLSARRDRVQLIVEVFHFSSVAYSVVS